MLLVALMLAAPPAEPVPPALHGVWRVTAEVMEGVPTPEECYRDLRFEIDANTLRLRDGDNVLECKAATDPRLRILVLTPRTGSRLDRPFVGLAA